VRDEGSLGLARCSGRVADCGQVVSLGRHWRLEVVLADLFQLLQGENLNVGLIGFVACRVCDLFDDHDVLEVRG